MDKLMTELSNVYKNLLTGKITCEEGADVIKSDEIQSMIRIFVNKDKVNNLVPFTDEDLQMIYMIINITQFIYNNSGDNTGISDQTYDALYSIMIANGGADIISAPIVPNSKDIAFHKYPVLRGTLTKVYYLTKDEIRRNPSRKYLDEWKASMEKIILDKTGRTVDLDNYEVYVFPKFDGVSGIFEYNDQRTVDRVLTRGFTETNEAQDITRHFKKNTINKKRIAEWKRQPYGLKTEIMMKDKDLKKFNETYNTNYKNTRSIVSAILNSDEFDAKKSNYLKIIPLRVGKEDGTQELAREVVSYPHVRCRLGDRDVIRKFANNHATVNGLRCDGAVIYIIDPEIQQILGRENDKNNFEVAYKFTEEAEFSEVLDIQWNVGVFGRLAPVAKIKPVKLKGNTIENISLGSVGRVRSLGLRKGDTIKVLYDIIPYLSVDDECRPNPNGELLEIPENCPDCGEELEFSESGDIASCNNPKCPCRIKGRILNYLGKMNIEYISLGAIDKLYKNGYVKSIKDIYSIKDNAKEIAKIDGCGETLVNKWIGAIESQRQVPDYMMFGSIGIENVSKKVFARVLAQLTVDELLSIAENNQIAELVKIQGIQEKSAVKICDGINKNRKLIDFLMKELILIPSNGGIPVGKFSVAFTKVRSKDMENFIKQMGGVVHDSLTKDTTFLCIPHWEVKSNKIEKAKKYGTKVVPIKELNQAVRDYLSTLEGDTNDK